MLTAIKCAGAQVGKSCALGCGGFFFLKIFFFFSYFIFLFLSCLAGRVWLGLASMAISGGDWQLAGSLKFLDGYRFSAFWLRSSVVSVLILSLLGLLAKIKCSICSYPGTLAYAEIGSCRGLP
jgi:ABC-type uncharacterized transport system permease subunit